MLKLLFNGILSLIVLLAAVETGHCQSGAASAIPGYYSSLRFVKHSNGLDTSGSWIAPQARTLRFYAKSDGIVKITAEWFNNAGIPLQSIDPAKIALITKGSAVPFAPIGLGDGSFDQGDAIYFVAQKNYGDRDYRRIASGDNPYSQYMDRFSDSAAYWVLLDISGTPSAPLLSLNAPALPDTVSWYRELIHHEPEISLEFLGVNTDRLNYSEWTSEDTWIAGFISPGQNRQFQFEFPGYVPMDSVRLWLRGAGYQGDTKTWLNHRFQLTLDGAFADSLSFNMSEQVLLYGAIASPLQVTGQHTINVFSERIQNGFSRAAIDWLDIEYPKALSATNNALAFANLPPGQSVRMIAASGFTDTNLVVFRTSETSVYQIQPSFVRSGNTWKVVIADTTRSTNTYFMSVRNAVPTASAAEEIQLRNLRASIPSSRYLIITAKRFESQAQSYAGFIQSAYGTAAEFVVVEDIYDSYSYGNFYPDAIRLFCFDYLRQFSGSELPYILIAGDANGDYKNTNGTYRENIVPGYGYPVSDFLLTAFDSLGIEQRAYIGRLPIRNAESFDGYRLRHEQYLQLPYNEWNKTVVQFSGGESSENEAQLAFYRNINNAIAAESVVPPPFGGETVHIYKTAIPQSDFGPYSQQEVVSILEKGGVAISYVGHSATTTWDNSINDPLFLAPAGSKPPLVTDFGCSSGRFAEPGIVSFSEKYISTADAPGLCYIGNSTFGSRTTSQLFPSLFYHALLAEGIAAIGNAHGKSKQELIARMGVSLVTRNAIQMSALIGDPMLSIRIPFKPDPAIGANDIQPLTPSFTDAMDSLRFSAVIMNYGSVPAGPLTITIHSEMQQGNAFDDTISTAFPRMRDSLRFAVPNRFGAGAGSLQIRLDPMFEYDELDETNNTATLDFTVLNAGISLANTLFLGRGADTITVLHPSTDPGPVQSIIVERSGSPSFTNPQIQRYPYSRAATFAAPLSHGGGNAKQYYRATLDLPGAAYSEILEYHPALPARAFYRFDSTDWLRDSRHNIILTPLGVSTLPPERRIRLYSAGPFQGSSANIFLDGSAVFPPQSVPGYFIAVFGKDSADLRQSKSFATSVSPQEADSMRAFLTRIPGDEIVAIVCSGDPAENAQIFGQDLSQLGANPPDSLPQQGSYAFLRVPGQFIREVRKQPNEGAAVIDTALSTLTPEGSIVHERIGPAGTWKTLEYGISGNAGQCYTLITGIRRDGSRAPLMQQALLAAIDIGMIQAAEYPYLEIETKLRNGDGMPPVIRSMAVDFRFSAELVLNYQTAGLVKDTVFAGSDVELALSVLNAGETGSSPSEIECSIPGRNELRRIAMPAIPPRGWFDTTLTFAAGAISGQDVLRVAVDPDGLIQEQYTSNNAYALPFIVTGDTAVPVMEYYIDGQVPLDGDYIASQPSISLYLSPTPNQQILEPESFILTIDGDRITVPSHGASFVPSSQTKPAEYTFRASLSEGSHEFRINGVTKTGVRAFTEDVLLHLTVSASSRILDAYTVPNPASGETSFTFVLTGGSVPESMECKIYAISGRHIRTIELPSSQLRIGQNVVLWDCRDSDGDILANGTYFYKLNVPGTSASATGKIAILR